jgi:GNAT superfamily N-acetyltransferase
MDIEVREAAPDETGFVSEILTEAALWLRERRVPLCSPEELTPASVAPEVRLGLFFLAWWKTTPVGVMRLTSSDPLCWPDAARGEALYLHSFAVRRAASGGRASSALVRSAAHRAAARGARYLRLDCEPSRPRLRRVYERFGFRHHSQRVVGPFVVSRYELPCTPGA